MQKPAQIMISTFYKLNQGVHPLRKARSGAVSRLCWLLLLFTLAVSCPLVSFSSPIELNARENALGSANSFGHARIIRPLGELSIGGVLYPVNLVFNTNPSDAPSAFGPYWRIPLFSTTVVQFNQYKLYWDGPDERRQFFILDQSYDSRRGEKVFIERGKDWKATVGRKGDILIEALDDSGWFFRYDEGQLEELRLGKSADICRVTYSGRGLPLYIANQANNRRIFEIEYRGSTDPERLVIGEQRIEVEMGDAELTAPDGSTNYRNYRVSFLRSLTFDENNAEFFAYSKADSRKRKVSVLNKAEKKVQKTLDLAVNRMEMSSGSKDESTENWIEWEAKSGFITADSGSTYSVKNDSWDSNIQEGSFDVTPAAVEMTRLLEGGKEQRWSYVWNSGVKVYTDLATGEVIRRTLIMSEGPANGKLRKREVLEGGRWTLDRKNSYDPKGRPVRAVQGDSIRIWQWEDRGDYSRSTESFNGILDKITTFNVQQDIIHREVYNSDGTIDYYRIEEVNGRKTEYFITTIGEKISKQSIMIDGATVFLKNQHGVFEFISVGATKPEIRPLSPKDQRLNYFNNKIESALSFGR